MGTVTVLYADRTDCHHRGDPARHARRGLDGGDPCGVRPAAPVTRPDPDSGESRAAGQPDAFGDWFSTTPVPPPQVGRPSVRRPSVRRPRGSPPKVRWPRVRRSRGSPPRARRPGRDRFGWLLSPWLLAPTAAVAVATTGVALWLWQTALTETVQARPRLGRHRRSGRLPRRRADGWPGPAPAGPPAPASRGDADTRCQQPSAGPG